MEECELIPCLEQASEQLSYGRELSAWVEVGHPVIYSLIDYRLHRRVDFCVLGSGNKAQDERELLRNFYEAIRLLDSDRRISNEHTSF